MAELAVVGGASNRPLLDALGAGLNIFGHVLVRRDGRVVNVEDARLDDWLDLGAQLDDEPGGPGLVWGVGGGR